MYVRRAEERGHANLGWLDSHHSFSFGHYYDPRHMGFSVLRVINDDTVQAGAGFDTHGHRDMEIISYVLSGSIEHKDSMGNTHVVPAGDIQRMSAGTGITHSEYNHSRSESLRFLQIWIHPHSKGLTPSYEQQAVTQQGTLTPLVTPDGHDGSLSMNQDASLYRLQLAAEERIVLDASQRPGYLHLLAGHLSLNNGLSLAANDAVGAQEDELVITAGPKGVSALWFDLPSAA